MKPTRKADKKWLGALGRRISTLRGAISQDAVAEQADIDRSQLSDIELGKVEAKIETLRAIAGALGKTLSELFEGLG